MTLTRTILTIIVVVASSIAIFAQDLASDVRVKLSTADGKSVYKIGQPVKLIMTFTADNDNYNVEVLQERWQPTFDKFTISPESGLTHWLRERSQGTFFGRDYFSYKKLTAEPVQVQLVLNDLIRFDQPGNYKVKVTTKRVAVRAGSTTEQSRHLSLMTNELAIQLVAMTDEEEATELKEISASIAALNQNRNDESGSQRLSYLTGDVSTREKVRRFLDPSASQAFGNYSHHIAQGLYIARNRSLVIELLEAAFRDPSRSVGFTLLQTLASLRFLMETPMSTEEPKTVSILTGEKPDSRQGQVRAAYVAELAASLPKRSGRSQIDAAMTILMTLPKNSDGEAAVLPEVRRILVQSFDKLNSYEQENLLQRHWEVIKDESLVPALKSMLANDHANKQVHDAALERLIELAPGESRAYIIAEIKHPESMVELKLLGSLTDKVLPELDNVFVEQISAGAKSPRGIERIRLKQKTALAARYGSEAIYHDLMRVYKESRLVLQADELAGFLAYFAKYNTSEALVLLQSVLDHRSGKDSGLLSAFTNLYYSDAVADFLKARLESDEPSMVSNSAYLISKHGKAGDEKVLEARLIRFRKEWKDRVAEAEATHQGMAERELLLGLLTAKSWKLSSQHAAQLKQGCLTKSCVEHAKRH